MIIKSCLLSNLFTLCQRPSSNLLQKKFLMILRRKVKLPSQPHKVNSFIVGPFLKDKYKYLEPRPVADFIYEEIEEFEAQEQPKLKLLLLKTIDELGVPGNIVEVDADYGRFHLLSSNAAVYASDYNIKLFEDLIKVGSEQHSGPSSAFVGSTIKKLVNDVILIVMNDLNPWTITPKHVQIGLRAAGYCVPLECISLPSTPITGPDLEQKQGKDFAVEITINNHEKIHVRCLLHHKSLPLRNNWDRNPRFILLEEQTDLLESMPSKEMDEDLFV